MISKIEWLEGANKAISMSKSSPSNKMAKRYLRRLVKASPYPANETAHLLSGLSGPWGVMTFLGNAIVLTDPPPGTEQPKYRVVKV